MRFLRFGFEATKHRTDPEIAAYESEALCHLAAPSPIRVRQPVTGLGSTRLRVR
jgi:hypothetical protein